MKRQVFAVLFLLALSSFAVGQAALPVPNIIDHQTSSNFGGVSYQFTENIASAYNILYLVVTCDLTNGGAGDWSNGCGGAVPTDSAGSTFNVIEHHGNSANDWSEIAYFAIVPSAYTSDVITFTPLYYCVPSCTYKAMIEQVQGIGADN